jgi:hypothetical protein
MTGITAGWKDKAIVRLLAGAAIKELPVAAQNPANYPRIMQLPRQIARP